MKRPRTISPSDVVILEKANRDGKVLGSTDAMRRDIAESICESHNKNLTASEKERGEYWMVKNASAKTTRIKPAKKSGKTRGGQQTGR